MKKLIPYLLSLLFLVSIDGCGDTPTATVNTPAKTKSFFSITGIASSTDTSFMDAPITVYAATNTIQTGTMLYGDTALTSPVKFQFFQVGGLVYYSKTINGQFSIVPTGGGSLPPRYIK